MKSKILFVNPVMRQSKQGRNNQIYTLRSGDGELTTVASMNKIKEFGAADTYSFPFNANTNKLETGLDEIITNPFFEKEKKDLIVKYNLSTNWEGKLDSITESETITKQTYFEIISSVDPDFYTSKVNGTILERRPASEPYKEPTYLQKFNVILYDRPNRFEDDSTLKTARERLCIQLIKCHNKIANNKGEVNSAYHNWYVSEENEAEREMNAKSETINKGTYLLYKLLNENTEYKTYQTAIQLKDHNNQSIIKGKLAKDVIKQKLNSFVTDQKQKHQIENIHKFIKVVNLLNTRETTIIFELEYLIQQAINSNIIKLIDGFYVWHSKVDNPNVYKFSDKKKLLGLLEKEYESFTDEDTTNWYNELIKEVKTKGVWLENE